MTRRRGRYSAALQTGQASIECRLAHRIIDHRKPATRCQAFHLCGKILGYRGSLIRPGTRQRRLLFGRDRCKDPCAQRFRHLGQQQSGPARSGMDQYLVAL